MALVNKTEKDKFIWLEENGSEQFMLAGGAHIKVRRSCIVGLGSDGPSVKEGHSSVKVHILPDSIPAKIPVKGNVDKTYQQLTKGLLEEPFFDTTESLHPLSLVCDSGKGLLGVLRTYDKAQDGWKDTSIAIVDLRDISYFSIQEFGNSWGIIIVTKSKEHRIYLRLANRIEELSNEQYFNKMKSFVDMLTKVENYTPGLLIY